MAEYDFSTDPNALHSREISRRNCKVDRQIVDKPLGDKLLKFLFLVTVYHLIAYAMVFWVVLGFMPSFDSYEQGLAYIFAGALGPFILLSRRTLRWFDAACPKGAELWSLLTLLIAPFFLIVFLHESLYWREASTLVWPPYFAAILAGFLGTKWMIQDKSYIRALNEQRPDLGQAPHNHRVMLWVGMSLKEALKHTPDIIIGSIATMLLGYLFGVVIFVATAPFVGEISTTAFFSIFIACLLFTFFSMKNSLKTQDKVFDSMIRFYAFVVYVALNAGAFYGIEIYLQG